MGELWARGLGRPVTEVAVVGDGSDHIDQVVEAELRLPGVRLVRILDLAHAQQHVWAASRAAFGKGSTAAVRWAQRPLRHLERGEVDALLVRLDRLADQVAAAGGLDAPTLPPAAPSSTTPPSWLLATRSAAG